MFKTFKRASQFVVMVVEKLDVRKFISNMVFYVRCFGTREMSLKFMMIINMFILL